MPKTVLLLLCLPLATAAAAAQDLYLADTRVVDPATREVRSGNLLIVDGRVQGMVEKAPEGFAGASLDLEGGWVIPGLNDLHTHSYGNMAPGRYFETPGTPVVARRMLYAGVTGFLDLFGNENGMHEIRERQRRGELPGADLYASLSCLTATEGHCTEYGIRTRTMDTPEEARKEVSELSAKQPDVVKIVYAPTGRMPSIDKATLEAAVATARELGLKTVIHVNTWQDVRDSVQAGASAVTHVPDDGPIPEGLGRLMGERGVASIPTLTVETDFAHFVDDPEVLDHPLARALAPQKLVEAYRIEEVRQHRAEHREQADRREAMILASVKAMADAGVTVLTGSDSGNWGTIQGYSLHRELQRLVDAGLTQWQAMAASTTEAGEFLGQPFGVQSGDIANLVVLEGSPLENISNTTRILHVIQRGKLVERDELLEP